MKNSFNSLILIALGVLLSSGVFSQGVAINNDGSPANASAMFDVQSTTSGMLIPRMTATERGLIENPATGLLVFQTDAPSGFYFYNSTIWTRLSAGLDVNGTQNYVTKFTSSSSLGNSIIYDNGTNVGIGTTAPGWKLDVVGNTRIGANASQNTIAALAVSAGQGAATTYRDIDMHGSWAAAEGHAITASHGTTSTNIVGQIVFQHDNPGSRIRFGRLYHSGDQATYPMELISNGSNGILRLNTDTYSLYGPNSSWGAYLQVGGNGRVTSYASVAATNGNLHIDAANGAFATYINYYSQNNTFINAQAGNVGIGTTSPNQKLVVNGGNIDVIAAGGGLRLGANNWSDGGSTYGHIITDNGSYDALMIVGNNTAGDGHRNVRIWDHLNVESLLTRGGYTVWDAANDGSGSGLDADLLDGNHASAFAASSHTHPWNQITSKPAAWLDATNLIQDNANFNNSVPSGFYQYNNATNAPTAGTWYNMINVRHSNTGNDHGFQIAASYYDENIWTRTYQGGTGNNNGTFTPWRALIHSGNLSSNAILNQYSGAQSASMWISGETRTGGWFRNSTSGNGLYNEATGMHIYSNNGYWKMAGGGYGYGGTVYYNNYESDLRGYVYYDIDGFGLLHNAGGWNYRCWNGGQEMYGTTYAGWGGLHANVLYDRDNTGYYTDANNWSVFYGLGSYYLRNNYDVSVDHPYGLYFANGLSTAYAIYRESGAWSNPYPDLRIAFHTGIKLGANASYGGVRFYSDYDMSSLVMSVNDAVSGAGANNVYMAGNLGIGTTSPTEKLYVSGGEVFIRGDMSAGKPSLYVQARNGNWGIWAENEYGYTGGGGGFAAPSGYYSLLAVGGTKNAIVKTTQGATALFCMESTEVWFEDIGGAKLVDGQAYVKLDPIFLETVTIDEENPMRVFIQPNGETQGLIVIKEADGFRVIEQNNGTNNISFDYRVLAKRKYFETDRLTIWPKPNHQPNESEQKDIDYLKKTLKN